MRSEFWCHFLDLEKWALWFWEDALSPSKMPSQSQKAHFFRKGTWNICDLL